MTTKKKPDYIIQSVEKAIELLKVFTHERPELSLTEIGELIGYNPSSTLRMVTTLYFTRL